MLCQEMPEVLLVEDHKVIEIHIPECLCEASIVGTRVGRSGSDPDVSTSSALKMASNSLVDLVS